MERMIETFDLVKRYGDKAAVNEVSIHVDRGQIYGLIGKNGAGKTTLMKLILGLANPTRGSIALFGGEDLGKARARIGSLIEAPGLYRNCTARENMLLFSGLYGADRSRVDELLELVGLGDTGEKKAGAFSLGMKQRLGIAIALIGEPEVLVLDEPMNGLDPAGIKEMRDLIIGLNRERGVTFVISSHILDELAKVATEYGIIADGRLVEEISAGELEERCRGNAVIKCSDPVKARVLIATLPEAVTCEISGSGAIILRSHTDQTARINRLLVENGVDVEEITRSSAGFEEYFIQRLGN